MKTNTCTLLLATTLAAAPFARGEEIRSTKPSVANPMLAMLEPLKGNEFDVKYLQTMIHHHLSGIAMAELVQKHSSRKELQAFAKSMINKQKKEADQMKEWLKSWYDENEGQPMKDEKMERAMAALNELDGDAFDRKFLLVMSDHHQGALAMAELAKQRSEKKEIQELSAEMISGQSKEVTQMTEWQGTWFK